MNELFKDKNCQLAIQISFLFWILMVIYLLLTISRLPPELPLFYSRPWGEEQLVKKFYFFIFPFGLLAILLFNLRLAMILKKELFLAKILVWLNVFISLLAGITIFKIISLVI